MPAKLTVPSSVIVNSQNTTLNFTNTLGSYLDTSDIHLLPSGQLEITKTKRYFVGCSVSFEQNGQDVKNTVKLSVNRNNSPILISTQSYTVNDELTINNFAYIDLNAGDTITVDIKFSTLVAARYLFMVTQLILF